MLDGMDVDKTKLGSWVWVKIVGREGHTTRVITAYQLVRAGKRSLRSAYSQQRRYYKQQGERECPRKLFMRYLITKIKEWISQGDPLIPMLDANKDMKNGNLSRAIGSEPKLKMKDLVRERECTDVLEKWCRGTKHIDGAFATTDVDFWGDRFIPFCFGIRDHRAVLVDITHQSLLEEQVLKVVRPQVRRLQCGLTGPKR